MTEFGRMVRRWRDRATPEDLGLPLGNRRRAAGLRREELARLAGISVDYVTRLEQGRAVNPSEQVVTALVRALRLSGVDREQLFHAAGLIAPGQGTVPRHVPPSVQRLLDRLTHTPVVVFDAAYTQLLANPMYTALMGEFDGDERNAVYRNFLGAGSRVRHTPQTLLALRTEHVAGLRAAARRYPADPYVARLVTELRSRSTLFAELWAGGDPAVPTGSRKTVDHPAVGPVTLDCDELTVAGADLRILVYSAQPGTRDAERLELLTVVGTQAFSD